MSYFQARLAEVQIPPKKPQKYLFHVPRTKNTFVPRTNVFFYVITDDISLVYDGRIFNGII